MNPKEFCEDEYIDEMVYRALAKREKNPVRKRVLEEFAEQEHKHYLFWKKLAKECHPQVSKHYLWGILLARMVFGLTFTIKFLEKHEEKTIRQYKAFLKNLEGESREELERIIKEEEYHEHTFYEQLDEKIVKYMSFIVLGLADAIVEITGVHAGFLGVTNSTLMAGVAGLIVGLSAAISMASAAYLQAKHDIHRNPVTSSIATGIAYISAVVILALPYFVIGTMSIAFSASVILAIILIAGFTFYGSILFDKSFKREFLESTGLMLGTAFGAFLFGEVLGKVFGIQEIFA